MNKERPKASKSGWKSETANWWPTKRETRDAPAEGQTDQKTDRTVSGLADSAMCVCVCGRLYGPAEPRQSSNTEAKLNGEGRLKAVPGPAASVFNHRSPPRLTLHADQAAVKGAMHPATPIHNKCAGCAVWAAAMSDFCRAIMTTNQMNVVVLLLQRF